MSVDALGDKALGVKISGGAFTALQEFVLAGPALINIGVGGLSADADVAAALAKKQVATYEGHRPLSPGGPEAALRDRRRTGWTGWTPATARSPRPRGPVPGGATRRLDEWRGAVG
jgi:hypothetical protein